MNVPNHIAIILDGNGRWAKAKGMPRSYGHVKGCANLETVCDYMKELGVKYVTVYAFSTENWKRSREEVDGLMKLFRSYLKKCIKLADKNKMRVRVIGEISAFDQDIQDSIVRLEEYSSKYDEIYFQIALNYGSRDEIVRGIRKLAQDAIDGKVKPEEIDEHWKIAVKSSAWHHCHRYRMYNAFSAESAPEEISKRTFYRWCLLIIPVHAYDQIS